MTSFLRIAAAIVGGLASLLAAAQDAPNHYQEPGFSPGREYVNQHFSEHIDPFTGNLELHYIDVFIPGNGPLSLKVQRSYNVMSAASLDPRDISSPFGKGWDMHFGRVRHASDQDSCSYSLSRPNSLVLELPDGSRQAFYKTNGVGGTSTSSEYLTLSMWKGSCDPSSGGMIVFAPDGTRYDMTVHDQQASRWLVSKITSRGNCSSCSLTFTYQSLQNVPQMVPATASGLGGGALATFTYSAGTLSQISAQGRNWQYTVLSDPTNGTTLTRVQPPISGSAWAYQYFGGTVATGAHALQQVTYPTGGTIAYTYSLVNFFTGTLGAQKNTVVASKTAAGGDRWTYSYAPSGGIGAYDVTTVTQPGSLPTLTYRHFGYNTVSAGTVWKIGRLNEEDIGSSQTTLYGWDGSMVISSQAITRPGYNKVDSSVIRPLLASKVISRTGGTYTTNYSSFDPLGNPQVISEAGNRTRTRNLSYTNLTSAWILGLTLNESISGLGTITRAYDSFGNMTSETRFGVGTTYTYTPDCAVASRTDANSLTTSFASYSRGVPMTEIRADGVSIQRAADSWGNVTSQQDGVATWTYTYDGLNRLTFIGYPVGAGATITWGQNSRDLTRGAYADDSDYDPFGRMTSRERGNILMQYRYDAIGRKTFESFPDFSGGTTFILDDVGRIQSTTSPHGSTTRSYSGNSVSITNERRNTTTYGYDRFGDPDEGYLNAINSPEGTAISMSRDLAGDLLSATQGSITRTYGYDAHLFQISINEPETGTTTLGRDSVGNLMSKTVGGKTINYGYDRMYRLTQAQYPSSVTTFGYDNRGLLTSVTNPSATRTYAYDTNGNMTGDRLDVDSVSFSTTYAYDNIDGLSSITYPAQMTGTARTVNLGPDALGRPSQVGGFANAVSYHNSGNLSGITFANGVSVSLGEDPQRLIPNSINASGRFWTWSATYGYDGVGNVTSFTSDGIAETFGYDGVDRLISALGPWGSGNISYSPDGNILTKQLGSNTLHYGYASGNRLTSVQVNTQPSAAYAYDGNGNVTNNGRNALQFDDTSALTCVDCNTPNAIQYAYDGKGSRVWQLKDGLKTYFQHAANGDLLFEYIPATGQWKQHAYLAGKRIATRTNDLLPTTTSLVPAVDQIGGLVSLTATVSPSRATGDVTFTSGSLRFTVPLVDGVAVFDASKLFPALYTFVATYSGDIDYAPSASAPLSATVNRRVTTITVTQTPTAPTDADAIHIAVSLFGDDPTPSGNLTLTVDAQPPIVKTLVNGATSFDLPPQTGGHHQATIAYPGDGTYKPQTVDASFFVGSSDNPPTVTLTSPVGGLTFAWGQVVNLAATASDPDETLPVVNFFDSVEGQVGAGSTPTYEAVWTPTKPGTHVLTAKVTDSAGSQATSAPVTIHVTCPPDNAPPTIAITSPINGATFSGPVTVPITVNASDPEGQLDHVDFYLGSGKIGTSNTAPYSLSLAIGGGGALTLMARAVDSCGASTDSAPVAITVNGPLGFVNGGFETPVIGYTSFFPPSPGWTANGISVELVSHPSSPWAAAPEGTQSALFAAPDWLEQTVWLPAGDWQVSFQSLQQPTGSATATVRVSMDGAVLYETSPAIQSWSYQATPTFTIGSGGSHVFRFDSVGDPQRSPSFIFIDAVAVGAPNVPPAITLTSPANNSTYLAGNAIPLAADASDADGSIAKVQFLDGANVIATIPSPPYAYSWTNAPVGSHTITARATDNRGATTITSTSLGVSVVAYSSVPMQIAPSGVIGTTTPTFSWNAMPGATAYSLLVQNTQGVLIYEPHTATEAGCPSGTGTCAVRSATPLPAGTLYAWFVSATNAFGSSGWSAGMQIIAIAPAAPVLVAPQGSIYTTTPTYTWNASQGADSYVLYVQNTGGPLMTVSYTGAQAGCATGSGTCSVTPSTALTPNVAWAWFVNATNGQGTSAWSTGSTITAIPPLPPTLIAPSGSIGTTTPLYQWNASPGATSYTLYVQNTSQVLISTVYPAASVGCPLGTGVCSIRSTTALPQGVAWAWFVNALNGAGTSAWSNGLTITATGSKAATALSGILPLILE